MPLFSLHSAFDEVVEAATPAAVPENDALVISKFLPVADKINASPPGSKAKSSACAECIRCVWKRVKNSEPLVGLHAVSLLDFLIKNCGVQFMAAFDDREFVVKMRDFIRAKLEDNNYQNQKTLAGRQVAESLKARIQEWAEGEMKHISWFPVGPFEDRKKERSNIRGLYNVLRRQGYAFPIRRHAASSAAPASASTSASASAAAEASQESEFERREREELELAIQASLKEAEEKKQMASIYPTAQLGLNSSTNHKQQNHYPQHEQLQRQQQQHHQQQLTPCKLVRALYDFEAMESDELTLCVGDVISVTSGDDVNWWRGKCTSSGKEGLFPASFVEDCAESEKRHGQNQNRSDVSATNASATPKVGSAATSAAANSTAASSAAVNSATASTAAAAAPRIDEQKIKMALHLIQQMDPGKTIDQEEEKKLRELEMECESMSGLINLELQATDRQHLQLMQINKKLADAMQMYHFLMVSETRTGAEAAQAQ